MIIPTTQYFIDSIEQYKLEISRVEKQITEAISGSTQQIYSLKHLRDKLYEHLERDRQRLRELELQ
jgi:hypothetical protein